ncbi:unnamed protein product [Cylicocyclus nassatus]|uniref:G-protein coupled receptors family 1 profile domain-containing protein n=1 Tax=Cylicocyclus nassatus TaxID=53992 RepID=A0AA36MD84_CYLNA|nr:unnamed protein product [Cylicocyclus nassatus]
MFSQYMMLSVQYFSPNQMVPRYVCIQLQFLPLFGGAFSAILIFTVAIDRLMSLYVFYEVMCGIMDAMHGQFQTLYMLILCTLSFFTLVTYVIFLVKVRRKSINPHMKEIYRSLIVTSFTIVMCSLAVGFGLFVDNILHIYSDSMDLLAGISINISIAANFFVYYAISKQHRTAINKYLYIDTLKSALGLSEKKVRKFVVTVTVIE